MSAAKRAPAPETWHAEHKRGLGVVIATERGEHVATVYSHSRANLAAAAPVLLRALEIAAATVELYTADGSRSQPEGWPRTPSGDIDHEAVARIARAAIAEALGGATADDTKGLS